jgi:TRAP-type C4-dicarboxylate transport system substrate-binding protein
MQMKKSYTIAWLTVVFFAITFCLLAPVHAASKPIELKVASWNPPHIAPSKTMQAWAKEVEEKTEGQVKFTFFWASSLAKLQDNFRATQTGLADIGQWVIGAVSGLTPLNEYISLPYLGFKDSPTVLKVFTEMQKTSPELAAEFKNLKYIHGFPMPPYHIHTTEKKVRVPEDLRGMKLLADANSTDFIKLLGAVPVVKGPPDWYMSVQKGLVEGKLNHWNVVRVFKLEELFKYHTDMGPAGVNSLIFGWWMNEDTWKKLPPKAQKVIMDLQGPYEQKSVGISLDQQKMSVAAANKAGHPIIELTPQELEKWVAIGEQIQQNWIDKMEAKGKPGRMIIQKAKQLVEKYNKE